MDESHLSILQKIFYPPLHVYFRGLYYYNLFSEYFLAKWTTEEEAAHTELQQEHKTAQENGAKLTL